MYVMYVDDVKIFLSFHTIEDEELIQDPRNSLFLENALKTTTEYFLKSLFYLKVQSFRLIMENNFIHSAGYAVANTIGLIFKHIILCAAVFHKWLDEYYPGLSA